MPSANDVLHVSVLGPLRVRQGRREIILRPAQRRLLSVLALPSDGASTVDALEDRMWGETPPETARAALHVHLSGLRRRAPGLLVTTAYGYRLDAARCRVDRARFDALALQATASASRGRWEQAARQAGRALALWRGPPFTDLHGDEFAAAEVGRLTALHEETSELHGRALRMMNRPDEAIVGLRNLVARQPLRERSWNELMLALHRAGRQAEALHEFQRVRRILAEELGVEPGADLRQTEERIRDGDPGLGDSGSARAVNNLTLPSTSFVGREEDLHGVAAALEKSRLVAIVGGPGVGKTRLALEAAHDALPRYRDGVWFVALGDARNAQDMVGAISTAVGLGQHAATLAELAGRLRHRTALVVLDNCEHLLSASGAFAESVLEAGQLRLLVTSRRALGMDDERILRINPLAAPAARASGHGRPPAITSPAVRLFVDRAREADRSFRLTAELAPLVSEICRRTSGIPLALELAARWVPALGMADIQAMLESEIGPPARDAGQRRHASLQSAMEWSVRLLPAVDRHLFISAAIFKGTFGIDDIRAIGATHDERRRVAAAIARLVEASLLVVEPRAQGRVLYRSLIPVREFARRRLERRADWTEIRERFVSHYLQKAIDQQEDPFAAVVDLGAIDDDLDNLREAFELGLASGHGDDVARAIVPLNAYFLNRYLAWEGRAWLTRALKHTSGPKARADLLRALGALMDVTNDLDDSLAVFREAIAAYRAIGDWTGLARCLASLASLHAKRGEWTLGVAAAEEARELMADGASSAARATISFYVGANLGYGGAITEATPHLLESARHYRALGDLGRASSAMVTLAILEVLDGKERPGRRHAGMALDLAERAGSALRRVRALGASAAAEARWGEPELSREQLLESHAIIGPYEPDLVFDFVFPAMLLLRRLRRWPELVATLRGAEAIIAARGIAYPEPWRAAAGGWRRDARRAAAPDRPEALREWPHTPESLAERVRDALSQPTA